MKAKKRSRMMGVSDMLDWIDTTGSVMAGHLMLFRRTRNPKLISEIRDHALAILAMCDVLEEKFDTVK